MSTTPKRGQLFQKRRSGAIRKIVGFTKKPDGIRRARMLDSDTNAETKVRVDQLSKSYQQVISV